MNTVGGPRLANGERRVIYETTTNRSVDPNRFWQSRLVVGVGRLAERMEARYNPDMEGSVYVGNGHILITTVPA